jgi:fatty acid desaturase
MKKNMGTIDRALRVVAALAVGVLWYLGVISGTVAIVLGVLAVVFVLTSLISFCPLYLPFGLSTHGKE